MGKGPLGRWLFCSLNYALHLMKLAFRGIVNNYVEKIVIKCNKVENFYYLCNCV